MEPASSTPEVVSDEPCSPALQPQFPTDLLYHLLDHCLDTRGAGKPQLVTTTLHACATVCKEWLPIVRKYLFTHVKVRPHVPTQTPAQLFQFLDANQTICHVIKLLRFEGEPSNHPTITLGHIWEAMGRLPILDTLVIQNIQLKLFSRPQPDMEGTLTPLFPWINTVIPSSTVPGNGEDKPLRGAMVSPPAQSRPLPQCLKTVQVLFVDFIGDSAFGKVSSLSLLLSMLPEPKELIVWGLRFEQSESEGDFPDLSEESLAHALTLYKSSLTALQFISSRVADSTSATIRELSENLPLEKLTSLGFWSWDHQPADMSSYQTLIHAANEIVDLSFTVPPGAIGGAFPLVSLSPCTALEIVRISIYLDPDFKDLEKFRARWAYGVAVLSTIVHAHQSVQSIKTIAITIHGSLRSFSPLFSPLCWFFTCFPGELADFRGLENVLDELTAGKAATSLQTGLNEGGGSSLPPPVALAVKIVAPKGDIDLTMHVFRGGLQAIARKHSVTLTWETQ